LIARRRYRSYDCRPSSRPRELRVSPSLLRCCSPRIRARSEACYFGAPRGGIVRRLAPVLIVSTLMLAAFPGVGSSAPPAAPPEAACPSPADTLHAVVCAGIKPVPSLAPSETDSSWHRRPHGHHTITGAVTSDCGP